MDEEEILLGSPAESLGHEIDVDESILLEALEGTKEEEEPIASEAINLSTEPENAEVQIKAEAAPVDLDEYELDYDEDDEREERVNKFASERTEQKFTKPEPQKSQQEKKYVESNAETIFKIRIEPNHLRAGFSDGTNYGSKLFAGGHPVNQNAPPKGHFFNNQPHIPGVSVPPALMRMSLNPPGSSKHMAKGSAGHSTKAASCPTLAKGKPPSLLGMNIAEPVTLPGKKILINPKFAQGMTVPPPMLNVPPPTFNASMPPPPMLNRPPLAGAPVIGGQWDAQVAAFLASSSTKSKSRRRSRSRSPASSYSSEDSYDSNDSNQSERSRSRSRSRGHRTSQGRSGSSRKPAYNNWGRSRQRQYRQTNEETIESARALGLDQEYLRKLEEQKKKREETLRRKRTVGGSSRSEPPSKQQPPQSHTHSHSQKIDDQRNKMKAYLVVRVSNVSMLGGFALKKVRQLAEELGEVKRCWQDDRDVVSVIFSEHDKAKAFMIKHNSKVWSGIRVSVNLEKAYLNLTDVA